MVIYLRHPIHGTKVAIAEAEAVYDEKSGWERYNPDTPAMVAPVNQMEVKREYVKRRTSGVKQNDERTRPN